MKKLVISFSDGEEVIDGITQAAKEHNVEYARFVSGEGELKDFELISDNYDNPSNVSGVPHFVSAVSGRIVKRANGEPTINFHLTINKKGYKTEAISGELKRGIVNNELTLELALSDVSKIIE